MQLDFKILQKVINGEASLEEQDQFNNWYNSSPEHKDYFDKLKKNAAQENSLQIDTNAGWENLASKLNTNKRSKISLYRYVAVAASFIVFLGLGYVVYNNSDFKRINTISDTPIPDFQGSENTKLILGTGEVIELSNLNDSTVTSNAYVYNKTVSYDNQEKEGDVAKKTNTKIRYNYIEVPRGDEYSLVLSDRTKVYLNSESKIKYPVAFQDNKIREVSLLYGEAYFDVTAARNANEKFIVNINDQTVEVLGTQFNVKAYKDESLITTTLVEGAVSYSAYGERITLTPDYKTIADNENKSLSILRANTKRETAWVRGGFSFRNKSLREILTVLSRWYDFNFEFMQQEKGDLLFNGIMNKNKNFAEALNFIKKGINDLKFYYDKENNVLVID